MSPICPDTGALRYTPIVSLGSGRLRALRVRTAGPSAALAPGAIEALQRGNAPPLALPAALLPDAPPAGVTAVVSLDAAQEAGLGLDAFTAPWRAATLRLALAGFDGRQDELVAVATGAVDEIWLSSRIANALARRAAWARGLVGDLVQVQRRTGLLVIAGGIADRRQLDAVSALGLAGFFGPLVGEDWPEDRWQCLRAGGYLAG